MNGSGNTMLGLCSIYVSATQNENFLREQAYQKTSSVNKPIRKLVV